MLTKHALIRLKQRGITKCAVDLTITHGKSRKRPWKVIEYNLGKREAKLLIAGHNDKIAINDIEKATEISVIVNDSNDKVITVYRRK